jgi:hypothetical protein
LIKTTKTKKTQMKSSTEIREEESQILAKIEKPESWEKMKAAIQGDIEEQAKESGALVRGWKIKSAMDLLRIILVYVAGDWRVHLSLDLGHLCIDGVEISDEHGAGLVDLCPG